MTISLFILLLIGIFVFGSLCGIIGSIISNKKNKNIPESFSDCKTYRKFTDQNDPSIDEVVKGFKLLDD